MPENPRVGRQEGALAGERTDLAVERTVLAYPRTALAWAYCRMGSCLAEVI